MQQRNAFKVQKVVATQPSTSDVTLHYDYSGLDVAFREDAQNIARTIKRAGMRMQGDALMIAENLLTAKEREYFPENDWQDWVRTEFGLEPRKAQLMLNLAREYKDRADAPRLLSLMGDTVAMMVSQPSIPATVRVTIEAMVQEKPLTTREAKRIIKTLTHKEALVVVADVLDQLDRQTEQRILNGSTHLLKKRLPEDVTLSDSVLGAALLALRAERLAKLMPPEEKPPILTDYGGAPVRSSDREMPPELVHTGWELRRLEATGEYFGLNMVRNVATETFRSWKSAVAAARDMDRGFVSATDFEGGDEVEGSVIDMPSVVQVTLPVPLVQRLLGAVMAGVPGLSDNDIAEFRSELTRSLSRVDRRGEGDVD